MDGLWRIGDMGALALHAMGALAALSDGQRLPGVELARQLDASPHTVRAVMNRLVRAGHVDGARGAAGGFRLARPAGALSLSDVLAAVEGPGPERGCLFARRVCAPDATCPFARLTREIQQRVRAYFERTTVADLGAAFAAPVDDREDNVEMGDEAPPALPCPACPSRNKPAHPPSPPSPSTRASNPRKQKRKRRSP